jgi:hypothetical protein
MEERSRTEEEKTRFLSGSGRFCTEEAANVKYGWYRRLEGKKDRSVRPRPTTKRACRKGNGESKGTEALEILSKTSLKAETAFQ